MVRVLGIDYGLQRTGLAISNPEGSIAFPLTTLRLKDYRTRKEMLDALAQIGKNEGVEEIVMGLPLNADGDETEMSIIVRNVAARIMRRLPQPLFYMPEFLSSAQARADLLEAGVKISRQKTILDQQAACRILSSFLSLPADKRRRA